VTFDVDEVEAMLIAAARAGAALTYSDALGALGHRFTRPLMRRLCVVLADVDARARGRGDAELAVLVVRQSDGLPGQGWWIGQQTVVGDWNGPDARAHVARRQAATFASYRTEQQPRSNAPGRTGA